MTAGSRASRRPPPTDQPLNAVNAMLFSTSSTSISFGIPRRTESALQSSRKRCLSFPAKTAPGEFRTKRLVLEIYNQIAAAKQARRAYQTRLKPAPADPKLLPCLCIAVSHGPAGPAKSRVMNAKTDPARTFAVASDEVLVGLIARARNRVVVIAPALTQALADALSRRFNDLGRLDITVNEHTSENGYRLECGVEGGWLRYASTTARGSIWIAGASGRGPWLVSLDHSGVIAEIGPLPHSPTPGPGLAQEAGATEAKLFEEFTQADFESPAPLIRRSFVPQYAS